jgi:hypothetical protein
MPVVALATSSMSPQQVYRLNMKERLHVQPSLIPQKIS